jgi:MoaA/NifB/PqqE/SkfB family radical SAM enzyme
MINKLNLQTRVLQLAVTEGCDSHCGYCNFWKIKDPKQLSLADLGKLFEVIDFEGIELLCITGGEPTEHPGITDIIPFVAGKIRKQVLLSSNCLNYDRLESIVNRMGDKIHTISTSLDGNEAAHDRNRGTKGAYKNVLRSLELAKMHGIRTKLAITVVKENIDEVPRLLEQYSDSQLDVKTVSLSAAYYGDNTQKKNLSEQKQTIGDRLYAHLRQYYLNHDVKNLYTFYNGLFVKHGIRPICTVGATELFVFPNADIFACYSKGKLANFRETTREKLDQLRAKFSRDHEHCTDCFARCSSSVLLVLGDYYQKIADSIVGRWRMGEETPELDYTKYIMNPK